MDVSPDKQNLNSVFSDTVYHIDFYQREYKWLHAPVQRLLDDIYFQFGEKYRQHKEVEPNMETVTTHYPWYYLNTYVTNQVKGKVYVVDGQQRLTTLTLILMKLRQMAIAYGSKTEKWLENKIAGFSGKDREYWMNHVNQQSTLDHIFDGKGALPTIAPDDATGRNLLENYKIISDWLDFKVESQHQFETFVFYILTRLVLIKLSVEQTDVPMVFEVINDRGVRLKPYEILKGKLLGQIDKVELEQVDYNGIWEKQTKLVNKFREDEIDSFFRAFLKAKYARNRKDGQRFDGDYHREMYTADLEAQLHLEHSPNAVKDFLKKTYIYYSRLYARIWAGTQSIASDYPWVFYNSLNEMDTQFLLIISACKLDDPEETFKIAEVSRQLDRMFTLLQLQNSYDSNEVITSIYLVANEIRNGALQDIAPAFDKQLQSILGQRRSGHVQESFQWGYFRNASIVSLNKRFIRYYFARVDEFLAHGTKVSPKHPIQELVTKRGGKTGFHVEHILSHNNQNKALFSDDEERFDADRNRLGGVLLLKGKDNISSSNEVYSDKLKTYANTLYWNETLRQDAYKSKLDFDAFKKQYSLDFHPLDQFGPEELEYRHRLLYDISKLIWF
ncbi:MAG: hypothetical protein A2527_01020 [Candidatus Lambdaproteobacteria bacterium RIFOXYD2_FULL_50_16]|uniref:DUF262 domain-containing protein n=1 Tax=Candidatus Lambdaproteobacteria bacterium RIFOXYD2_FULL_50_16 TaxID=1817772 RepID=A0A1F6G9L4_9PROT|nr:MAG: hypothetical protein A2527_01020 [Candidatus Lambdaproteobacteria bacterium RIFOXYD2_FULL_50_16]